MKNIKPTANGDSQEVKIKVRINANGVILLTSANLVDKKAIKAEENVTDNGAAENQQNAEEVSVRTLLMEMIFLATQTDGGWRQQELNRSRTNNDCFFNELTDISLWFLAEGKATVTNKQFAFSMNALTGLRN